jgi:hypothetical protein
VRGAVAAGFYKYDEEATARSTPTGEELKRRGRRDVRAVERNRCMSWRSG